MAEGLSTIDGEQLDVDQAEIAFAAAMAAPPVTGPHATPPDKRPPRPADDPEAAPFGWTFADGEWRPKKAAGRPSTKQADKPRISDTQRVAPAPTKPAAKPKDWRKVIGETLEAGWFVLATAPIPDRIGGYNLTGVRTRVRVQAALVETNADSIAAGLNTLGQHNRFVARALDRLSTGDGGLWVLPATMLLAPFCASSAQLWSGQLDTQLDLEAVAKQTEENAHQYIAKLAEAATGGQA